MFEKIKAYYDGGLWSLERVWNVVGKALTAEEYEAITGKKYSVFGTGTWEDGAYA